MAYYVDAHSHVWTQDTASYPFKAGVTLENSGSFTIPSWTADELLETAASVGVGRAVLIAHGGIYGWDNSYMIESARAYPDQLRVVGAIDVDTLSPSEVESAMRELLPLQRVTGFRIERLCDKGDPAWLQSPGMDTMWRVAAETGQAVCAMMHPEDIDNINAMCERFPDTTVVLDHMASVGENVRFGGTGVVERSDTEMLVGLARHPNVYVKISAFYALGGGEAPYHDLIPLIERLLSACEPLARAFHRTST
jgi:predicted TIM-barrel fold metal-dependent hydrolase